MICSAIIIDFSSSYILLLIFICVGEGPFDIIAVKVHASC